ncbi:MAG: hypothetical protein K1000chlam3_01565 [Chlamydiae bacterium]|nr:hypothetical protein [Chlamydiota bacterium]
MTAGIPSVNLKNTDEQTQYTQAKADNGSTASVNIHNHPPEVSRPVAVTGIVAAAVVGYKIGSADANDSSSLAGRIKKVIVGSPKETPEKTVKE